MFKCLIVSPRDIRCHIAGIVVDEVQRAVVDAQPERHRVTRSTILSQKRAAANETMMPTLWLSICGVMLRDLDFGAHAAAGDGSLAILQFDLAPGPELGLVHLGGIAGGVCLEGQDDLGAYVRAFELLSDRAESPRRSAIRLQARAGYPPS